MISIIRFNNNLRPVILSNHLLVIMYAHNVYYSILTATSYSLKVAKLLEY